MDQELLMKQIVVLTVKISPAFQVVLYQLIFRLSLKKSKRVILKERMRLFHAARHCRLFAVECALRKHSANANV